MVHVTILKGLGRSIIRQSVEALDAFVNLVESQLVDLFCIRLGETYASSQLALSYTLAHVTGVEISICCE